MAVRFFALPIIFFILLLGIGVLVAVISVAIARRAPRKNLPDDNYPYDPDSDSMAYRSSHRRPSAQKTGSLPWIIVGMALTVGLAVVLIPLLWARSSPPSEQVAQIQQNTAGPGVSYDQMAGLLKNYDEINATGASIHQPSKNEINVPIDVPVTESDEKSEPTDIDDIAIDELDEELDRSGASLLLSTILDAAVKSFKKRKEQDSLPSSDTVAETDPANPTADKPEEKKPQSPLQSFTKAMGAELPDGIDKNTLMEKIGRFLGKAIAAENAPRPAWVDEPNGIIPNSNQYRTVVTVGPYLTRFECERQMDDSLQERAKDYASTELGLGPIAQNRAALSQDQLRDRITRTYLELANTSAGTIVNLHVELIFDSKTRDLLRAEFRESLVHNRIKWSGVALGCMTLFLLCSFAVLKLDPLFRRRVAITVGVGVVILLGVGIVVLA